MNTVHKAKMISYSKDNITGDITGLVAYFARVSNPENQINMANSEKLIQYLIKNNHWSPFEMVHMCIEVETTRDIARQLLRHRSFSFQEFSQRYAKATTLGLVTREARLQDTKNRQNSIDTDNNKLQNDWQSKQQDVIGKSLDAYNWAIDNGIAKEVARSVLPEGMIISRLYIAGNLRSFIHYLQLRMDLSTQKEHRILAQAIKDEVAKVFPIINTLCEVTETSKASAYTVTPVFKPILID